MPPKFDPSQVVDVFIRVTSRRRFRSIQFPRSEDRSTGSLPEEDRRRHRQRGRQGLEGPQSHRQGYRPESSGQGVRCTISCCARHQGVEGAGARQEEDKEHQA
ncbi:unnamed protein product [Rhodiola kirilowii]